MQKRIQRKRTRGWKIPKNTIYVGRPTKWGNPFNAEDMGNRNAVILYKEYILATFSVSQIQEALKGKNLACWCKLSEDCHADVLLKIANEE